MRPPATTESMMPVIQPVNHVVSDTSENGSQVYDGEIKP
jgi:hypothetical protein